MICFSANNGVLVEDPSELPGLPEAIETLYLDFETSSNDPKVTALNPWREDNCTAIGAAVTWDKHPKSYYVPIAHFGKSWLQDALARSKVWCNHNVKYDAHVLHNSLGLTFNGDLRCTLAQACVYDSDRQYKGGYGLDALAKSLLQQDISEYELRLKPYLKGNKDYGRIPIDILAEYGCQDPLTTRELDRFFRAHAYQGSDWVVDNETKLTRVLVDMERNGLFIDTLQVKVQLLRTLKRMSEIEDTLQETLGQKILPTSYNDCFDLLINQFGFPMIRTEESKGEANFDKYILQNYVGMGTKYSHIVLMIAEYRSLSTHKGLFWEAWLNLVDKNGVLHSDYKQNVRSGRTASKQPNSQQLDKIAKSQIRARPGYIFMCYDYSQLEYRWMMHYLHNERAITAYNEDPNTDYHQLIADQCQIQRGPAKTLNFTIGFGGGKARVTERLSINPDVIARTNGDKAAIRREALALYEAYHRNLPELKRHQMYAQNAAMQRGYVQTCYGRRLRLDVKFAFKGFNRVIQSTAADTAKEALVAVSPVYNTLLRDLGVRLLAIVHDEFLFEVPEDRGVQEKAHTEIKRCLELPSARCRVPIVADRGEPAYNWKDAK